MTVKDLARMFDYGYWANRRLFAEVVKLAPEQFTEPYADGHGSIRKTLVHMLSAEWGWLARCGGPERGAPLEPTNYPSAAALIEAWGQVEGYVRAFLATLREEDLTRIVEFTLGSEKRSLPVFAMLQQAANHAIHHRGQVSLVLRLRGFTPDNFDIVLYDFERASGEA
jgi:uncharacterized damage-inducible protein DinB